MTGFTLVVWHEPVELWQPAALEASEEEIAQGFHSSPNAAGGHDDALQYDQGSGYGR